MHERNTVEYGNAEKWREAIIRAFFKGVELEGKPITTIRFRRVLNDPTYHGAALKTEDDEVYLRFPPDWNPGS